MKITKTQLKKIIKEEIMVMNETRYEWDVPQEKEMKKYGFKVIDRDQGEHGMPILTYKHPKLQGRTFVTPTTGGVMVRHKGKTSDILSGPKEVMSVLKNFVK